MSLIDFLPMAHPEKNQMISFNVEPNAVASHTKSPPAWRSPAHKLLAVTKRIPNEVLVNGLKDPFLDTGVKPSKIASKRRQEKWLIFRDGHRVKAFCWSVKERP